ncbi:hypothetical protein PLESTF_001323200 [Pleodorina starrii]|nr:hypothetical protein PLESTM_000041800 [Pleodorina starrii]GLC73022.1 hypothetical protein PLESTF_001323200 [Pleodorina starrii]
MYCGPSAAVCIAFLIRKNWLQRGAAECEYVMYGMFSPKDLDFMCCAHGLSGAPVVPAAPVQCSCDSNVLHTPYRLDFVGDSYTRATDTTVLNFTLTYDDMDCDASDPTNAGCCSTDLKDIYVKLNTTSLISATVNPAVPGGPQVGCLPL